jgi:hypothetical protein
LLPGARARARTRISTRARTRIAPAPALAPAPAPASHLHPHSQPRLHMHPHSHPHSHPRSLPRPLPPPPEKCRGSIRMAHPGPDSGVVLFVRLCADPTIYVIDEGTASMRSHRRIPYAAMHRRTVQAHATASAQKRPMSRTARWIIILLTVSGSIGSGTVATSAFASSSHQPAHQGTSTHTPTSSRLISRPWMY